MAKLYYFKYTTVGTFDGKKTVQHGGIVAANSYAEAMAEIEKLETVPKTGECDLVSVDNLEDTGDAVLWTDDLELFNQIYEEMM